MRKVALGLAMFTLLVLLAPAVFACEPPPPPPPPATEPGLSPGFWKHEVRAFHIGRGAKHFSTAEFDVILAGVPYTLAEAYAYLWDNTYKSMWLDIANAFNAAAGLGPYMND